MLPIKPRRVRCTDEKLHRGGVLIQWLVTCPPFDTDVRHSMRFLTTRGLCLRNALLTDQLPGCHWCLALQVAHRNTVVVASSGYQ